MICSLSIPEILDFNGAQHTEDSSAMESTDSSTISQQPNLPPGFRFHPTDEELVVHYLKRKASSVPVPVAIIAEVDLYKFDPWELPAKASFGEQEWYFFSPRDRKYPNGARPNRAATSGYWKATGTDKPVLTSGGTQKVGVKKALVFYGGKPPKGVKTNWIMHEYRLTDNNKTNVKPPVCDLGSKKNSLRLDDWVLCRIYQKNSTHRSPMDHERDDTLDDMMGGVPPSINVGQMNMRLQLPELSITYAGALLENDHNLMEGMMSHSTEHLPLGPTLTDTSNSLPPKRTLSSLYWHDHDDGDAGASGNKRVISTMDHGDGSMVRTEENGTANSFSTCLSQLPQTLSLGSVGDGLLRQPHHQLHGMSWYL